MVTRGVTITGWAAGVAGGLVLAGLGAVFIRLGVAEAHKLAGTLGIFVNVTGLAVAVYSALMTRRSLGQANAASTTQDVVRDLAHGVQNTINGGQFAQPVVQARDVHGLTFGNPNLTRRGAATGAGPEQPDQVVQGGQAGQPGQATEGQA